MSRMQTSRTFDKVAAAWARHPRYLSSRGGTRSGKTYSMMQLLAIVCSNDKKHTVTSVVSETMPHLKRGVIRDFKDIMGEHFDPNRWSETDKIYSFPGGGLLEFFSADSPGKVHGPARDRLFLNEAQNIPYDVARHLFVRTRGIIAIDYNPTHSFWLDQEIEGRDNCECVHSTYLDNQFLTPEQVAEIEDQRKDAAWWRVYGEGKVGVLQGVIYDFEQIDAMPEADGLVEFYGLDFGFTVDPTAIVRVLVDTRRKIAYIDEVCYRTRMLNEHIVAAMQQAGIPLRSVPIYADCASPKDIADIAKAGFNVKPCTKEAPVKSDKMLFQIQFVKGYTLKVTKRSLNIIRELRGYTWATDKDGNQLNHPIDLFNHALDAMRYGIYTHLAQNAGKGTYTISSGLMR